MATEIERFLVQVQVGEQEETRCRRRIAMPGFSHLGALASAGKRAAALLRGAPTPCRWSRSASDARTDHVTYDTTVIMPSSPW